MTRARDVLWTVGGALVLLAVLMGALVSALRGDGEAALYYLLMVPFLIVLGALLDGLGVLLRRLWRG